MPRNTAAKRPLRPKRENPQPKVRSRRSEVDPLRLPLSRARIARALVKPAKALFVLAAVVTAAGCSFFLFGSEQAPELLLYERFDWIDEDDWTFGAESGYPEQLFQQGNRVLAYDRRQFMQTKESFGGRLRIILEWSVVNGDAPNSPAELGGESDFRITLNNQDVTAALTLYDGGVDSISILDRWGSVIAGPLDNVPTSYITAGRMIVRYDPDGDDARIEVSIPDLGLDLTAPLADAGWFASTRVTFGLSGTPSDPRALETAYIIQW